MKEMPQQSQTYPTLEAARVALYEQCTAQREAGRRPVVLLDAAGRITPERRLLAQAGTGFGVEVSTLPFWVADLWLLHGDGRTLVDAHTRMALAAKLLSAPDSGLPATPGMVDFICRAARDAFTYRNLPAHLVGSERSLVALLDAYAQELGTRKLCEYGEALEFLAQQNLGAQYAVQVFDALPTNFNAAELSFLQAAGAVSFQAELSCDASEYVAPELAELHSALFKRKEGQAAVRVSGALSCALSAGPSAARRLILGCVQQSLHEQPHASVLVASRSPQDLFEFCAPYLREEQVSIQLHASIRFDQTDAGRAILDLISLTAGPEVDKLEAADFSYNPFAGIWYGSAFRVDQVNRANRLLDASDVLSGLAGNADDSLQGLIGLFEEADYQGAIGLMEAFAQHHFATRPAYLAQQLKACAHAKEVISSAVLQGAPVSLVVESLAKQTLAIHCEIPAAGTPLALDETPATDETAASGQSRASGTQLIFTTMEAAAAQAPASVGSVILADLNMDSYPIRAPEDALLTLLGKWGKAHVQDPLTAMRRNFFRSIAAAQNRVVVQRSLNTETADPAQPAALFEELMDCYRGNLASYADVDKTLGIPQSLVPYCVQAGEDALVENARGATLGTASEVVLPPVQDLEEGARDLLVLPRNYHGQHFEGIDLSASQIESYLECPYQWFAKRRLRVEGIDEGFGALERGTFMHHALQAFYERFIADVAPKLTHDAMDTAITLLDQAFAEQSERDMTERNPGNRYVPTNAWEAQVRDGMLPLLRTSLRYEADFLPHFHPQYFEWGYGESTPYSYAGCNLCGRIDRIDVDDAGHAVVVDYKSSLSPDYRLRASEEDGFVLPRKMQTLIYANVVREQLGLDVVGALYFNPLNGAVQGAFDARVLGPADFPVYKPADMRANEVPGPGIASFNELIDKSEAAVAARMQDLSAGNIEPSPLSPRVCEYCPVGLCYARLSGRVV